MLLVGNLSLLAGGVIQWHAVPTTFRTWWLGDSCGALVVLPLILAWARPPDPAWRRSWEMAALICAVLGLSALGLSGRQPLTYLVFPALIWAALRFGTQGGTVAVVLAVAMTVWRTAHHVGPFVQHSITDSVLSTQLFIAVAALTTLCLAAIVTERRRGAVELLEARRRTAERGALERQRIARDLHDSVSQTLFSMTLHARAAQRAIAGAGGVSEAGKHELGQVVDLSRSALGEMRSLIFELRPEGLADEGLVSAIRKHAAVLASREGIRIEVHGPDGSVAADAGGGGEPVQDRAGGARQRDQARPSPRRLGDDHCYRHRGERRGLRRRTRVRPAGFELGAHGATVAQ